MSHSVGVAMLGGNPIAGRKAHDFYATPPDVTLAVLDRLDLSGSVHEFACGDGAICKLLEARGVDVIATDLHDRGYGEPGHDVLAMSELRASRLISNPPFNIAPAIIAKVMPLRPKMLALLLKSTFWHAKTRLPLFRKYPPSHVYALSWRPDFEGKGAPTLELSWMVWDRDHVGGTVYDILERPPGFENAKRPRKAAAKKKAAALAVTVELPLDPPPGAMFPVPAGVTRDLFELA